MLGSKNGSFTKRLATATKIYECCFHKSNIHSFSSYHFRIFFLWKLNENQTKILFFFFSQTGIVWWVKGLTNFHIRKFPNKAKLCRIVNRPPPPPHIYCHLRSYQSKFCMLMNVVIAVNNRRTFTNCRFPEELHEGIIVHVQSRSLEFAQVGFYKWKIVKKKKNLWKFLHVKVQPQLSSSTL